MSDDNKMRIAELEAEIKAMLTAEDYNDLEDDGEECEGMSDAEFNYFLEALAIVVEHCKTVDEAVASIRRIQKTISH